MLDVRSPSEFAQGHIPGAKNLPLFTDEERAEVGTLYKQVSPEKAFMRGLDIAGAKMSWFVREAFRLAPEKNVGVHCWRGGKRSSSVGTLLQFSGFEVNVLEGGYKAFRNFCLTDFSERKTNFIVLGGKTGSGKTEILHVLKQLGEQVVDLEGLAHHKGSAFGALGEEAQPTVEQFENNLFAELRPLDPNRRVWVENESRSIGKMLIPAGVWEQIKAAPLVHLEMPFELRVERLQGDYAHFAPEELEACVLKIEKRMGGQHVKAALEAFRSGDVHRATAIALEYYDRTYLHATATTGNFSAKHSLEVQTTDAAANAQQLLDFINSF